jgi:hypothetical protein
MAVYGFTVQAEGNVPEVMKKMETAIQSMGVTAKVEVQKAEAAFAGMREKIGGTFKELRGMIMAGFGITAAFAGFEFVKQSKEAFDKLEESVSKVNAALASTKGVAGKTLEDLEGSAKSLSKQVIFGRAQIMDAQSMLLTFTSIRGEIYDRTIPAIADFATRFKMDLPEAANTLGKALNDPLTGMTKLQRQGVVFSAAQKETIKKFVETGQVAKAQGMILKELETEFGGLAKAMAGTDEGKIAMAKKQWGSIKLEIGEMVSKLEVSLIPAFGKIMQYVKAAFESTPVQFFLHHIKDLVNIVLKIIPMWIIYKTTMAAIHVIHRLNSLELKNLITLQRSMTTAVEESKVAAGGFKIALLETGVGAFAIALGWIVEQLSKMNAEIDEAVDNITHLKDFKQAHEEIIKSSNDIHSTFKNRNNLSTQQKGALLIQAEDQQKKIDDQIRMKNEGNINNAQKKYDELTKKYNASKTGVIVTGGGGFGAGAGGVVVQQGDMKLYKEMQEAGKQIKELKDQNSSDKQALKTAEMWVRVLKREGVKESDVNKGLGSGIANNAYNTAALAGARGGLGEAKVINIKIDTMQKIVTSDNKQLKARGQDAVEVMLRTLNNVAYSQSSTQ